jgi:hypothetical protein
VAVRTRDGRLHARSLSFAEGYPDYLSYAVDAERRRAFLARRENVRRLEYWILEPDGTVEAVSSALPPCATVAAAPARSGPACCYRLDGDVADTAWIAVMSDGVHSFTEARDIDTSRGCRIPVALPTVLRELLAFKSMNGVFVQRRVQRVLLSGGAGDRGWQHSDDLAIGVIAFGG